jgi:hypothetical protein
MCCANRWLYSLSMSLLIDESHRSIKMYSYINMNRICMKTAHHLRWKTDMFDEHRQIYAFMRFDLFRNASLVCNHSNNIDQCQNSTILPSNDSSIIYYLSRFRVNSVLPFDVITQYIIFIDRMIDYSIN